MKGLTNEDILKNISNVANKGVTVFEENSKINLSASSTFEVFMFNILLAWTYYLERDYIDTSSNIGDQKLMILVALAKGLELNLDIPQIVELYRERFKNFKEDIRGIQNSNYPQTGQYLPAYTFAVIFYHQLELSPNLSWSDTDDFENFDPEKMMDLSDFTGTLITQINWVLNKMGI